MITLMRKNIRYLGYGKVFLLFAGCLLFPISGRMGHKLTLEQHILSSVSDHYYLTYFLIPLVMLSLFSVLEDDEDFMLFRFGSYYSYFYKKWFSMCTLSILIILIQTICIWLSGIGLESGNNWVIPAGAVEAEIFIFLQQHFDTPFSCFMAYTIVQFTGIWFLAGIGMWIRHFAGHKWTIQILMVLYVLCVLWIKLPVLQRVPFTGINHLLILHHNLTSPNRVLITAITILLLMLTILWMVRGRWHFHVPLKSSSFCGLLKYHRRQLFTWRILISLIAVVAGIILYKGLKSPHLESGEEWIYLLFAGHGTGYFHMLSFLEMLIINGAVVYLLGVFLESAVSRQSIILFARIKGRKEWMLALLAAGIEFLLLYSLSWGVGGYVGLYVWEYTVTTKTLAYLVSSVTLKFMDVLLQFMILLAVYLNTKQVVTGFLLLLAGNLLCIMPLPIVAYLPFGLSSMFRIYLGNTDTGIAFPTAFGILASIVLLLFLWLFKYGYRKSLD